MAAGSHTRPGEPADVPAGGDGSEPVVEPDGTTTASLATALRGTRFGPLEVVDETGSTNDDLVARAAGPAGNGMVLLADHQTAGRGRMGRTWEAPRGANLTFSVLLRPAWLGSASGPGAGDPGGGEGTPDRRGLVTPALAVAVAEVVGAMGLPAAVKWPNDVVVEDELLGQEGTGASSGGRASGKLAGILAELVTGERPAVVVGLGLNVAWPPASPEPGGTTGSGFPPGATSLARAGVEADRWWVFVDVLSAFDRQLATLERPDGPERLREDHLAVSATVGTRVRVETPGGVLVGEAVDLTPDGALVVVPDGDGGQPGVPVEVRAGDVTHLRAG